MPEKRNKKKKRDTQNIIIAILLVVVLLLMGFAFMLFSLSHIGDGGIDGSFSLSQSIKGFFSSIKDSGADAIDNFSSFFSNPSFGKRADYVYEHTDADRIVFLGDSLTYGITFTDHYDRTFTNLGVVGDSISAVDARVYQAQNANPEKIFLLCGINSVRSNNVLTEYGKYVKLVEDLQAACPDALIYVQSVLPVSAYQEYYVCSNSTIVAFNGKLQELAYEKGLKYVDLYSQFVLDGVMNPDYTTDGVHLTSAGYSVWENAISKYL